MKNIHFFRVFVVVAFAVLVQAVFTVDANAQSYVYDYQSSYQTAYQRPIYYQSGNSTLAYWPSAPSYPVYPATYPIYKPSPMPSYPIVCPQYQCPQYPSYPQYPNYPQYPYPQNQRPVINGFDGPTTLAVNQVGTWVIRASDPENGTLSYNIDWGDSIPGMYQSPYSTQTSFVQSTSFTHSYATAGTYTVTITVRDNAGLTAETRLTVYVSSYGNYPGSIQVTSPNGGEVWRRGTQQYITWTNPYTQQYPYNQGTVKITLEYRCPTGHYCAQLWSPSYTIQQSAPNSGSSLWYVGTATRDGVTAVSVSAGTYVVTVCRLDSGLQNICDTSNEAFTLTD